ncbi:hypothetical protein EDF56_106346 [Novosphingobium sp. PhB165]|uniref:hypothetical protein n=1 Tax=Novosphingobium sp. PhB165 TaxID=2485105 RepID=UPI00104965F3|nr:hypothetical protein [Novosphingobium sp. PhB165]TCM17230.1 hypothetical protein EDF56_106346 [Novosphingobium sp. PhB165]
MAGDERLDEIIPTPPTLERLEEIVSLAEQRCKRAKHKLDLAAGEIIDADTALERAKAARTDWIANNPDPQLMML